MDAFAFYRVGNWCWRHRLPLVPRLMQAMGVAIFSASIPPSAQIARTAALGYGGIGVIVHARAVIGENTLLGPGVVIGGRSRHHEVPVIGDDVYVGAGAKILGPVHVGDGSIIGANAVVTHDVAGRTSVAGVPARVIRDCIDVREFVDLPDMLAARRKAKS